MTTKELTRKMHLYFQQTINDAKGVTVDEHGKRIPNSQRQIASVAGLCIALEIGKDDFYALQFGTDEEQAFFKEMLLWFEQAANAMLSAGMIDNKTYLYLSELFKEKSIDSDSYVNVIFSKWNAPDDWEDYEELKAFGEEQGWSFRQMKKVLEKAEKAGLSA